MATDGSKLTQLPELTTLSDDTMLYAVDDGEDYHVNFETIKDETVPEVFTPTTDGLVPHPNSGNGGKVLRGDGTWQGTFDSSNDGLVPKLGTNDKDNVLRGDGTWVTNDKLIGTGSGSLVTFDAIEAPMPKLKASIVAKQDLHGYDHPWVGGAGKNKAIIDVTNPAVTAIEDNDGNVIGIRAATGAQPYVVTIKVGEVSIINGNTYTLSGSPQGYSNDTYRLDVRTHGTTNIYNNWNEYNNPTITATESVLLDIYIRVGVNYVLNNVLFQPQVEIGSQATSFAPYSNVCPIDGWTEAKVKDEGKNIAFFGTNGNSNHITDVSNDGNNLQFSANGTYSRIRYRFNVVIGRTYTISFKGSGNGNFNRVNIGATDGWDSNSYGYYNLTSEETTYTKTFTAESNLLCVTFYNTTGSSTGTMTINEFMVEQNNQATTFEPYNGVTTTISLPQTVYGGELDVVNGGGSSKFGLVDLSTLPWEYNADYNRFQASFSGYKRPTSNSEPFNAICSCFNVISSNGTASHSGNYGIGANAGSNILVARDEDYTSAADFIASLTGQTLCYELATPTTFETQPTPIKSLNGLNNLSVDSGEVIEVEYQRSITEAINALEAGGGGSITEVIMGGLDRVYGTTQANYIGTFNAWASIDDGKTFSDYDEIILVMKPQATASYGEKVYTAAVKGTLLQHYDKYAIYAFPEGSDTVYVKCGLDYTNNKFYLENFNYVCPIALVGVKY